MVLEFLAMVLSLVLGAIAVFIGYWWGSGRDREYTRRVGLYKRFVEMSEINSAHDAGELNDEEYLALIATYLYESDIREVLANAKVVKDGEP